MLAYFFKMDKRPNSTKQPVLSQGRQVNVELKDETSFTNPTLKINNEIVSGQFSPDIYNYVFIPYWQRYYFINDWIYMLGIWECTCVVDVLASFKTDIGNVSTMVIRSSSDFNTYLSDGIYPLTTDNTVTVTAIPQNIDINTGCYIIGIVSCADTPYRKGAVTYYSMSEADLNSFMMWLYSDSIYNLSGIVSVEKGLWKAIQNPGQYIVSCMWFPIRENVITNHALVNIDIGYWQNADGRARGRIIEGVLFAKNDHLTVPTHPQANRGEYLNFAPYTKHILYYPPFGAIPIDTSFLKHGRYLHYKIACDITTGQASFRVYVSNSTDLIIDTTAKLITERTAQVGIPIQLSNVGTDLVNTVTSTISNIGEAVRGDFIGATEGIIGTATGALTADINSLGYNGSFLATFDKPMLVSQFFKITGEDKNELGRPLMAVKTLRNIPGYIITAQKDHSFSGTKSENEQINRFLSTGFFYE